MAYGVFFRTLIVRWVSKWVDFTRTGILPVSRHLIKTLLDRCGQIWFARSLFSTVLRKACLSQCHLNNAVYFSEFQCIAVHCSALVKGWGWGSELRQSCFPQNSCKKWPSKSYLATAVQQSFLLNDAKQAKFPSWWNLPI